MGQIMLMKLTAVIGAKTAVIGARELPREQVQRELLMETRMGETGGRREIGYVLGLRI
jgi:hypothetical protein